MEITLYIIIFFCILGLIFAIKEIAKQHKHCISVIDTLFGPKEYRKKKKYNLLTLPLLFIDSLNKPNNKPNYNDLLDKYFLESDKYYSEALKLFPSKHLVDQEKEWLLVVEKQNEYYINKMLELKNKFRIDNELSDQEFQELENRTMAIGLEKMKKL